MTWEGPLPNVTEDTRPFWEALREHKFKLLRCKRCGAWYWPPAYCRGHENEPFAANMEWTEASGRGKVFVHNIVHWNFHPAYQPPYVYALVELEEGPLFGSNVVGCDPGEVRIGMPVEVVFEDTGDGITLPKFKPC